jgi:uncharacterized iron-regulated membrane protein
MMTPIPYTNPAEKKPSLGFFSTLVHHPRQTFMRKVIFQIHLWTGILLSIYVALIGLSGAITVFRADLTMSVPHALQSQPLDPARYKTLDEVATSLRAAHPKFKLLTILAPDEDRHAFGSMMRAQDGMHFVTVDPYSARVLHDAASKKHWAMLIGEFHENMFLGRTGEIISGMAAIALLLTLFTGIVLWWPGIVRWVRALGVNFRAGWKRINFDLHSAIGFWTLLFAIMWCATTIVMVWPEATTKVLSRVSPVTDAVEEPKIVLPRHTGPCPKFTMQSIVDTATASQPQTRFAIYSMVPVPNQPIRVFMARGMILNRGEWDEQFFDPCDGKQLFVWKRWIWKSAGDAIVAGAKPLHVGFVWGRWAQWTWFIIGISFPVLAITGLLMYWNRYLSKKWRAWRSTTALSSRDG